MRRCGRPRRTGTISSKMGSWSGDGTTAGTSGMVVDRVVMHPLSAAYRTAWLSRSGLTDVARPGAGPRAGRSRSDGWSPARHAPARRSAHDRRGARAGRRERRADIPRRAPEPPALRTAAARPARRRAAPAVARRARHGAGLPRAAASSSSRASARRRMSGPSVGSWPRRRMRCPSRCTSPRCARSSIISRSCASVISSRTAPRCEGGRCESPRTSPSSASMRRSAAIGSRRWNRDRLASRRRSASRRWPGSIGLGN